VHTWLKQRFKPQAARYASNCSAAVSETAAKNQGFAGGTATHSKAQGANATTIS
jgi:hypothetical protein